ncbi:MAG: D-glycero-beta-D-manno-heptose-7-phosphate kinase [Chlorobi bacterium]|nr:D-glycero-beta-D-manno-heptose-7-phosphate kinase [Chlorobiota bacterium]
MSVFNPDEVFGSFKDFHILVVGDVMIDAYISGKVSRISPEAPVPVISLSKKESRLGGAANVALNIQALGATPVLCSVTGDDEHRKVFEKLLKKRKLISDGLIYSPVRKTTVKTRVISQNHHLLRIDEEIQEPLNKSLTDALLNRINVLVHEYNINAVIFEDYDKGVITPELIKEVVKLTNDKGIPTLVDPKKRNFMYYEGVTFFKPNFKEFIEGVKTDLSKSDRDELVRLADNFRIKQEITMMMITLSENGIFIVGNNGHEFIPAEKRDIFDVSGAGDTVISAGALCLAAGLPEKIIARVANMAGGLVCEVPGVVPVDKEHLLEECKAKNVFEI